MIRTVWKMLDRIQTETVSNDDLTTRLEIPEALSELRKGTAPDPDKVKYSYIKNLPEDDKR